MRAAGAAEAIVLMPLRHSTAEFARRVVVVLALTAAVALVWYASEVFLLAFAGALVAIFLDFLAAKLAGKTGIGRGKAFAIVAGGISLALAVAVWVLAPRVADQISALIHILPIGFERLQSELQKKEWGRELLSQLPSMIASADLTHRLSTLLNRVFEGVVALVVIAAAGLYLGADPELYRRGFLQLVPEGRRARTAEVLSELRYTLLWWVLGQMVPMVVLGIATTIGLALLGVHLAFTLGLFTGFMIFIPYIGSVIALIVTVLVALTEGSNTVLYVVLWFLGVHIAEGYLLTPMVQKRAVYLPPGLTILSQVLLGLLVGFLGLALATPLTAAGMVLVQMLYLHKGPKHHG
jgi:predicted PurR-regulated permease PerM